MQRNQLAEAHANQPIGVRTDDGRKTPAEAAAGQKTLTMVFPQDVHLTIGPNHTVYYPAGAHEVPEDLAEHWYLKACGAIAQAAE
jgi:hypothetical protein